MLDESALPGQFAVFERFLREVDMHATASSLTEGGIAVRKSTEGIRQWRENVIVGHPLQPQFWIEIPERQFSHARYLLRELAEEAWAGDAIDEHPFADYTDDDLRDIVTNEEYYGVEASVVALNLLLRRGVQPDVSPLRRAGREQENLARHATRGSGLALLLATAVGTIAAFYLEPITACVMVGILLYVVVGKRRAADGKQSWLYTPGSRRLARVGASIVGAGFFFGLLNYLWFDWVAVQPLGQWYWIWR